MSLPDWYTPDDYPRIHRHLIDQGFPTVEQLRRGILLGCIADALFLAGNSGDIVAIQQWEGSTYVDDNTQGERWVVDFCDAGAVAVYFTKWSDRNPYPDGSPAYDQSRYFRGMPDSLNDARTRALDWMLDFDFVVGGPNTVITAAMWAEGERFTAGESWADVYRHGGEACHRQLLALDAALDAHQEDLLASEEQVAVMRALHHRRLARPAEDIVVEAWEHEVIVASTESGHAHDPGILAAREKLAAIGIRLL